MSRLDLSNLNIDDHQILQLTGGISKLTELKTLKLNGNKLTERGLKRLLKALMNSRLEYLFAANNKMTGKALDYLLSFSKYNTHLRSVCLQGNSINEQSLSNKEKIKKVQAKGMTVFLN